MDWQLELERRPFNRSAESRQLWPTAAGTHRLLAVSAPFRPMSLRVLPLSKKSAATVVQPVGTHPECKAVLSIAVPNPVAGGGDSRIG